MTYTQVQLLAAGLLGIGSAWLFLYLLNRERETRTDLARAQRIRRSELDREEIPEPVAGFGGHQWKDAGTLLKRLN